MKCNTRSSIVLKTYNDNLSAEEYLNSVIGLLPELDTSSPLIRSGKFISEHFKKVISSYKILATLKDYPGAPHVDVIDIKAAPSIEIKASSDVYEKFIRQYFAENSVDIVFAVITPFTGHHSISYFCRAPRMTKLSLPEFITDYIAHESIKNYVALKCSIDMKILAPFFSSAYSLYDDTVIRARANEIDASIKEVKFCDIACGSGDIAIRFCQTVTDIRMKLNSYIGQSESRTPKKFADEFIENSLYATDCDAGALLALRLELTLSYPTAHLPQSRFIWGSVLTEDTFSGTKFDIIATNPPHMRQELFSSVRDSLTAYVSSSTSSDLYCYYMERAFSMLKQHGILATVTSNRWMYSEYGRPIRDFLLSKNVIKIIDFGEERPLDGSTLPVSIMLASDDPPEEQIEITTVTDPQYTDLFSYTEDRTFMTPTASLSSGPWSFEDTDILGLLSKIRGVSITLQEYISGPVSRGILTGLNEAFIVNQDGANVLIKASASSAQLLRPFLSGRNVKRYKMPTATKYLIFIPRGYTDRMRRDADPFEWFAMTYPAVAAHLAPFEQKASARRDKGDYWWELRSCKYYGDFDRTKIICPSIVRHLSAVIERDGIYSNDKTAIIPSDDLYLLGLLNSSLMDFFFRHRAKELLNNHYELTQSLLASLPIHPISGTNSYHLKHKKTIGDIASRLMQLHSMPKDAQDDSVYDEIIAAERELNKDVFQLYKMTPGEISAINNN